MSGIEPNSDVVGNAGRDRRRISHVAMRWAARRVSSETW